MKYVVALAACAGVIVFWAVIGATVFNWQHGGGFLWQIFIWGTVVAVWVAVTSAWRSKHADPQSPPAPPDRSFIVKSLDVFNSIQEHDQPSTRKSRPVESPAVSIDDSQFFAQAMAECTERQSERDPGLWAKAFSIANGNETVTQAKYIELRAADLLRKERAKIQTQQLEERQRSEEERVKNLKLEIDRQAEQMNKAQLEFAARYPIGKHFLALFKHFGHRVTRMSIESDAGYADRLQRFAHDFERETGMKLE